MKPDKDLKKSYTIKEIDKNLMNTNKNIEENLNSLKENISKGLVAQNILSNLRTLTDMLMCHLYLKMINKEKIFISFFQLIKQAKENLKQKIKYNFLLQFHAELQIVISHYMPSQDNCERLLLKYADSLQEIHDLMKKDEQLNLLNNLEELKVFNDESHADYYKSISIAVLECEKAERRNAIKGARYYIWGERPFIYNNKVFYEVTYSLANDSPNKLDRMIAFTDLKIFSNYAVKLNFRETSINENGIEIKIRIITKWKTSIRNCEFNNFYKLVLNDNVHQKHLISKKEMEAFNYYLTSCKFPLSSVVLSSDNVFNQFKKIILNETSPKKAIFLQCLCRVRIIVQSQSLGKNTLLYLLYHMNNRVIKLQTANDTGSSLSGSFLKKSCYPFEKMPYIASLFKHNPRLRDIIHAGISLNGHEDELFARKIKLNTEKKHKIFTPVSDLKTDNYLNYIKSYNKKLWSSNFKDEKLVLNKGKVYINGYVDNIEEICKKVKELSKSGIVNYKLSVFDWFKKNTENIDDNKQNILLNLFENSRVSFVYGPAGTGKTTLIKYFSEYLNYEGANSIFLAQTNTALNNLRKRVNGSKSKFYTVSSFIKYNIKNENTNVLIIDECSTVSNKDICSILNKAKYNCVLLVGDTFQIPSIQFGNWFSIFKRFSDSLNYVFNLTKIYRTNNEILQRLWNQIRNADSKIEEFLVAENVSKSLDSTLFDDMDKDNIILCLNYDGLYGINNINKYLQNNNPNKPFTFNSHIYKKNDPILFNDSDRFYPTIYNNMKGKIVNIVMLKDAIQFDVKLDTVITGLNMIGQDFQLIHNSANDNKSIIRFRVKKGSSDSDLTTDKEYIMPFSVTYAMSIHKAQGLEFDEVKLVVDGNREESLNLNTFYTAVTRTRNKLNIYWTHQTENKFLNKIKNKKDNSDFYFLYNCYLKEIFEL